MRTFADRYTILTGRQSRQLATVNGKTLSDDELVNASKVAGKYEFAESASLVASIVKAYGKIQSIDLNYNEDADTNSVFVNCEKGRVFANAWKGEENKRVSLPPMSGIKPESVKIGRCTSDGKDVNNIYVDITAVI